MGKKEKNTLYVSIGLRLREYRTTYLKITQEKMAEILGISLNYYGQIERGENGVSLEKLLILHDKLGLNISYLITGEISSQDFVNSKISECPIEKRYDLEQLIQHALNLAKPDTSTAGRGKNND